MTAALPLFVVAVPVYLVLAVTIYRHAKSVPVVRFAAFVLLVLVLVAVCSLWSAAGLPPLVALAHVGQ